MVEVETEVGGGGGKEWGVLVVWVLPGQFPPPVEDGKLAFAFWDAQTTVSPSQLHGRS